MMTTNFSITYFAVANEIEGSGMPAWLLIADAEGMSVLTAWAAGKFDADKIVKTIKTTTSKARSATKRSSSPARSPCSLAKWKEKLPGWNIMVGPARAVDIPSYYKNVWSQHSRIVKWFVVTYGPLDYRTRVMGRLGRNN